MPKDNIERASACGAGAGADANAYETVAYDSTNQVTSALEDLAHVRGALEAAGIVCESAELTMVPKTTVAVESEEAAKKLLRLMDALEDNEDVQDVYANFDIPERILEAVAS